MMAFIVGKRFTPTDTQCKSLADAGYLEGCEGHKVHDIRNGMYDWTGETELYRLGMEYAANQMWKFGYEGGNSENNIRVRGAKIGNLEFIVVTVVKTGASGKEQGTAKKAWWKFWG